MQLTLIGDTNIHTKNIKPKDGLCIILGDVGLGTVTPVGMLPKFRGFKFITGDEDRIKYLNDSRCMNAFAHMRRHSVFTIAGGEDYNMSTHQLSKMRALWTTSRPRIVCTHECPENILYNMFGVINDKINIRTHLQDLLNIHQPQWWVFSHWKKDAQKKIGRTTFVALDELSEFKISI